MLTLFLCISLLCDPLTIRSVIEKEVPQLEICSLNLNTTGADHVVADVNGEWIFRFPIAEKQALNMERELWLLQRLQKEVSIPIPYVEYHGLKPPFSAYRKLKGELLDAKSYLNLSGEQKRAIAEALAYFFTKLHRIPIEEARQKGYETFQTEEIHFSENNRFKKMVDEANAVIKNRRPHKLVLLHNDLHGENMVFDPASGKITGIFDFSDVVIGDYAIDFARLFSIHPQLTFETIAIYAQQNHLPKFEKIAAADYVLRRAAGLKRAQERKDTTREAYLNGILDKFTPVWDSLNINH